MTALLILKSSETLAVSHEKKQWRNWGSRRPGAETLQCAPIGFGTGAPTPNVGRKGHESKTLRNEVSNA